MKNGQSQLIGVDDLVSQEVSDLAFTRLDFNGAVYQLLIGLLQTAFAPKNIDDWSEHYKEPPSRDKLMLAFEPHTAAFELLADDAPAFMQDLTLSAGENKSIATLLIEAPGGKTIKDNTDHFTKRGFAEQVCQSCATAALYCLQCSAPSGGVGHRTSLRGGGGLTTLVLKKGAATLWQKLWLNVLPSSHPQLKTEHTEPQDIFPWLAPSNTSEKKGSEILRDRVNPLQMFWGMPRRIRLDSQTLTSGHCDLCGCESEQNFTQFKTKNYGPNYGDGWLHLLTPYRFDDKKKKPPLSIKGKQGGLSYKDWMGIAIGDIDSGEKPAAVISHFINNKLPTLKRADKDFQIWCFAYDMDNMKARCWYEHRMPLVDIPASKQLEVATRLKDYINLTKDTASVLRQAIKQAWFKRPKDAKGDISKVERDFWQVTSTDFYDLVWSVLNNIDDRSQIVVPDVLWRNKMTHHLKIQFEHWALDRFTGDRDLQRIMQAKESMNKIYYSLKSFKKINERILANQKEQA
jgi:CRISPR system Cascade subunit CasA